MDAEERRNTPDIRTELVSYDTDETEESTDDLSTSISPSPCPSPHIHRHHKVRVFDVSDDELELDDEPPFEARNVQIIRDHRVDVDYDLKEVLGKGKFGMVYKCMEKTTSRNFAAKFIEIKRSAERKEVENEIDIMKELQHPRLLQLYDAYDDGLKMAIIMELASGGELFNRVIDDEFVLTEKICTVFMRQICEGVEFMHSKNIIHLDMKPENILCVTPTGNRIKLIDFGLARKFSPKENISVLFGTPEFVAPEVVNYDRISLSTDMWSVGVICYILLSGLSPFMGDNDMETLSNVTNAEWDFEDECFESISEDAKDFITKLLIRRPEKRMTATQCLRHRWLQTHAPAEASAQVKQEFEQRRKSLADTEISKSKLRHFVIRRRWQKIFNTIRALRRMGFQRDAFKELPSETDSALGPSPVEDNPIPSQPITPMLEVSLDNASIKEANPHLDVPPTELVFKNVEMVEDLSPSTNVRHDVNDQPENSTRDPSPEDEPEALSLD